MPKAAKDATEFLSSLVSRKRSDGKLRYGTTVPREVAKQKGNWRVHISNDDIMTWKKDEN